MKQKTIHFSRGLYRYSFLMLFFFLLSNSAFSQTTSVSGTVTDDQGKALEGANIQVQGTAAAGSVANSKGQIFCESRW